MPIVRTCNLLDLPNDDDLKSFVEDHHLSNDEDTKASLDAAKIWHYFKEEFASVKNILPFSIDHPATFAALKNSLFELIKNSVDAKATKIMITLPDVIQEKENICITYEDFGKGFDKDILKDENGEDIAEINFNKVLKNKLYYPSKKIAQKKMGEKHLNGGAGIGLSILNAFLNDVKGQLIIGNNAMGGAKIQMISPTFSDSINFDDIYRIIKKNIIELRTDQLTEFAEKESTIELRQNPRDIENKPFPTLKQPNKMGLSIKINSELVGQKIVRRSPFRQLSEQAIHERKPVMFSSRGRSTSPIEHSRFRFFKQNAEDASPEAVKTPILAKESKETINLTAPKTAITITKLCGY